MSLGRGLAVCLLVLLASACRTVSANDRETAAVHQNLAKQSLSAGDFRSALGEVEKALEADPGNAEALNLRGLLLHLYFARPDEAIADYRKALELEPGFTEARVNLGALLVAERRCPEAVPLLEKAQGDLLYREPYLAENNLGWCKYLMGDVEGGIAHLRAAVAVNPRFCLGYRNLAEIMDGLGRLDEALRLLERYGKECPSEPDADRRRALVLLKQGERSAARGAFLACREKARETELAEECLRQAQLIPEQ
ncbi:MAG: tetratricopeptide repeat protein [Deltaproteobacteria bacterium]|nr:tetratricopeptide repeat protein [Deltaproteobacteria bacterium]